MNAVHGIGSRLNTFSRLLLAAMVVMGVTATSAIVASTPAFAAGAPTIGQGYGAFENNPVINLTGCTGTSSSTTLTCTSDPLTAGVTVGMGVYGLDLNGTTPNSVAAVTATTVGLTADPSAAVTAGATETFTNNSAMANVSGSTISDMFPASLTGLTFTQPPMTNDGPNTPPEPPLPIVSPVVKILNTEPTRRS